MQFSYVSFSMAALFVIFQNGCYANVFTSVMKMQKVPIIESELINILEKYLEKIDDKVREDGINLKKFLESAKLENSEVLANPQYVENPINSYRLLRRVTGSWNDVIQKITCDECDQSDAASEFAQDVEQLKSKMGVWPSEDDFTGATLALIRLKNAYKLSMKKLSQGIIYDTKTTPLTGYEFSMIGDMAREKELVYESVLWYNESVNLLRKEPKLDSVLIVRTLKKLSSAWNNFGMPTKSITVTQDALTYDPENPGLKRDLEFFNNTISRLSEEDKKKVFKRPPHLTFPYYHKYEGLCRGQIKSPRELSKLYCNFRATEIPLIWSKVEYANVNPPVVIFHDVISDSEIDWMKTTAIEQLKRSVLGDVSKKSSSIFSESRISENAWLSDNYDVAKILSRRITLFSGLDASVRHWDTYAEPFQVLNYGLGGMYEPHYDSTRLYRDAGLEDNLLFQNSGDRVATWMFYLTDVEAGGATVFPLIKARVPPIKGAAAFWFNMKRSGEKDEQSLHAGCPVLLGVKWGANKWFREIGQTFRHGCTLNPDE